MAKRAAPRRPKKAPAKVIIGVKVSKPTKSQLAKLRKVFAAKAVAILGLEGSGAYNEQQPLRRRSR